MNLKSVTGKYSVNATVYVFKTLTEASYNVMNS